MSARPVRIAVWSVITVVLLSIAHHFWGTGAMWFVGLANVAGFVERDAWRRP